MLLVVAAMVLPRIAQALARDKALGRCAELEQQRAQLAVQGTDPVTIARIDSELRACQATAQQLGADVDLGVEGAKSCASRGEQISQEWAHYRSTEYSDSVKRNNTRNSMLRFGEEMARCFEQAIDDASSPEGLRVIKSELNRQIAYAEARETCYLTDASGCGRFGLSEDHGNDKARQERERVILPLRTALAKLDEKRTMLERSSGRRTA